MGDKADQTCFCILGIRLKTTPVRLMGGGTRQKPCIWFSGFWSQGDGACFEGYFSHGHALKRSANMKSN